MAPRYKVVVDPDAEDGYEFRGGNLDAFACKDRRYILAGAADTGKSMTECIKLHLTCLKYAGSQHAMVRKTFASIAGTCGQTFERIAKGSGVKAYGGSVPQRYIYPNGSTIWVGGMDKPDRILSAERDTIYICQAEELSLDDFDSLSSRCTGRNAVVKHPQVHGDANPGSSHHWIKQLEKDGKLKLFTALHKDNPTLFTKAGDLVKVGAVVAGRVVEVDAETRLQALMDLSGMRRKRLFEGLWISAEGVVYDNFDSTVGGPHVRPRRAAEMQRFMLALDEGYTNPQVILLIGSDADGRWHIFAEWYVTKHLESAVVAKAREWFTDVRKAECTITSGGKLVIVRTVELDRQVGCEMAACDDAAPGLIASLNAAGVHTRAGKGLIGGNGKIKGGIDKIQDRLKIQTDGLARLTLDPACQNTINEFESYVWKPDEPKEKPEDHDNHALGALRYLEDALAEPTGAFAPGQRVITSHVGELRGDPDKVDFGEEVTVTLDDFE